MDWMLESGQVMRLFLCSIEWNEQGFLMMLGKKET